MARIPRTHNSRSLSILPGQVEDDGNPNGPAITVTTYSQPVHGPLRTGHISAQIVSSAGLTGTWSLWYSLVPHPELANDNDWVQDTTVTVIGSALALAGAAGNTIIFGGNVLPEWWRLKFTFSSGTGTAAAYSRVDGDR